MNRSPYLALALRTGQDRTRWSLRYNKADVLVGERSPLAAGARTREISMRQSSLESFLEEED